MKCNPWSKMGYDPVPPIKIKNERGIRWKKYI
jgi:putative component of membrane protein insertase Oxa1/YidC/SpoIIIJ protein YidD